MAATDRVIAETLEARNALESYVYEMRPRASEESLKEFIKDSDREVFVKALDAMEEWLYDEGSDAQRSEYKKRLDDLRKPGDAAEKRQWEANNREENVLALKKEIGRWDGLAQSQDEKYSHIAEEERAKVKKECTAVDEWLAVELTGQGKLQKYETPTLTCDLLQKKQAALAKFCSPIMNKAKPPPPKPKEEKKEEKPAETAPAADAADAAGTEDKKTEEAAAPANDTPKPKEEPAAEPAKMDMD